MYCEVFDRPQDLANMNDCEVRDIVMILAGYYACQCEHEGGRFESFGADSIKHCYEYREIVKGIRIPHLENGRIDTETLRDDIYNSIFNKYLPEGRTLVTGEDIDNGSV